MITPRPWYGKPTASLGPQYAIYSEADGRTIAIVYAHENAEADTRLMTAAPLLLEALQRALMCPALNMDELEDEDMQTIDDIRAAIAAAE